MLISVSIEEGLIMPGRDGTGPLGRGPRTGRGLGPCGSGRRRVSSARPRLGRIGRGRRAGGRRRGVRR